jgi:xylulokinase
MSGLVLTRHDATAVRPCLLLADSRGKTEVEKLPVALREELRARSGNVPSEVFTIGKLLWVRDHEPDKFAATDHVLFPKDFIRMRLTGTASTEPTDAGNSLLLTEDLADWDTTLLERAGLPVGLFPQLLKPTDVAGVLTTRAAEALGIAAGTPVVAGASDMACAALGCGAVTEDIIAINMGTAGTVLRQVADIRSDSIGTVTFHPHAVHGSRYALGSILSGGLSLSWSARALAPGVPLEELLAGAPLVPAGSGGTLFLPMVAGAGTPWWEPDARGAWVGLNASVNRDYLVRAVLEGVAFNVRAAVEVLVRGWGPPSQIRFGGGGSRSRLWAQIIAGVLNIEVFPITNPEATALGAAALAAVGVGWFDTPLEAANAMVRVSEGVPPDPGDQVQYEQLYPVFHKTYRALRAVDKDLASITN